MFRAMSFVTVACSSMAVAIDVTISLTSRMTSDTRLISAIPVDVDDCTPAIRFLMSSVAAAVC